MNRFKFLMISSVALFALAFAGVASAVNFTETLTKDDFLNSGFVDEANPLVYDHTFSPGESVASIDYVYLAVVVTDDFYCVDVGSCQFESWTETESALLSLNDAEWKNDQATFNVFWGDVTATANIQAAGDSMTVTIESDGGDFIVYSSSMFVMYNPGESIPVGSGGVTPSTAVPEPSAAMVFLIGGLTLSRGLKRRR